MVMMIYGIIRGSIDLDLIFNACFLVGAIIIGAALVVLILPSRALFDKLTDHSNIVERTRELRERKRERAISIIFLGIMVIIITGIIQIFFWLPGR